MPKPLRVIFAGTPVFARVALARLCAESPSFVHVVGVLTQPDRPAGRGLKLQASDVKQFALSRAIPVIQPRSLRLEGRFSEDAHAAQQQIEAWRPDIIVVAAYGLLLPTWTLEAAPLGCLNIHASLLPRWRGAAPIHRAIEAGDAQSGICIMQMNEGLDTGDILTSTICDILPTDTTDVLHDRLAHLGAALLCTTLSELNTLKPIPQSSENITYARKVDKAESWIDWSDTAINIARRMRAFTSAPGLQTHHNAEILKIWQAHALESYSKVESQGLAPCGTVLQLDPAGMDIQCAQGILRITELQRPGGKRLNAGAFILGSSLKAGDLLQSGPLASL